MPILLVDLTEPGSGMHFHSTPSALNALDPFLLRREYKHEANKARLECRQDSNGTTRVSQVLARSIEIPCSVW